MSEDPTQYNPQPKRLHLGCGKAYLPGFLNVDLFSNIKADAYHDVTNLPYERASFDEIYCCHLLEHVHRHAVLATLNHWKSLLRPGGTLRLAVPNFEAICDHYSEHKNLDLLMGLLYGGQDNYLNRHTVTFDRKTLTRALEQAGFTEIGVWDWRQTEQKDHDDFSSCFLPHMQKDNPRARLMSLNMKGKRPEN